jgi:hypothetical protein
MVTIIDKNLDILISFYVGAFIYGLTFRAIFYIIDKIKIKNKGLRQYWTSQKFF